MFVSGFYAAALVEYLLHFTSFFPATGDSFRLLCLVLLI